MDLNQHEITLFFGLMLVGYLMAKWTKLDDLDNRYIETILMILGGLLLGICYESIDHLVIGAFIGLASAGSYNWLNNIGSLTADYLKKRYGND